MTLNQEVEIIYRYIVQNYTMKEVAAQLGWEEMDVSETVRGYGFNEDHATRKGPGKDKGRYARGKPACRGVNVTREIIADYLNCADEYNWKFEHYIADIVQDMIDSRNRQQQMEQLDRQQSQREAEYQRQQAAAREQQRRQAEQNARMERERREREAYAEQQRQRELERQRQELEKRNKDQYLRLVDMGKKALRDNRLQIALDSFYDARKLFDSAELYSLIAEVLAKSGNADTHCQSIIRELREYEYSIGMQGQKLSGEQNLWFARAYVADGQKSNAAYRYSLAAEQEYNNKNYVGADSIYKENYQKTGIYTNAGTNKFFKLAYSRSCITNMTAEDHRFCIAAYKESTAQKESCMGTALGNMAWHYINLGENQKAVQQCKLAMNFANREPYVFNNLFDAYTKLGEYENAYSLFDDMDRYGISYPVWKKAECIYRGNLFGDESRAKAEYLYKQQVGKDMHLHSLYMLLYVCESDTVACEYGRKFLDRELKNTEKYKDAADKMLRRARRSGNEYYIGIALEYNPAEKARVERQKQEMERIERERIERERIERERKERELQEKRRLEQQQLEREIAEKERLEKERLEKERLEKERQERERQRLAALKKQQEEQLLLILL